MNRHDAANLPSTEESLNNWCQNIWAEKEERLKLFYKDRKFDDSTQNDGGLKGQREAELKANCARYRKAQILYKLAIFYFILIPVVAVWLIYKFTIAKYCVVIHVPFFIIMTYKLEGFEMFQIDYYNRYFNMKRSISNGMLGLLCKVHEKLNLLE